MTGGHRAGPRPAMAVLALVVAVTLGACSGSEPTPAEARRDRVETRLRSTFSAAQADCILDRVDEVVLKALDRSAALDADSVALTTYSGAVTSCVADPDGTTTIPAASTTAPGDAPAAPGTPDADVSSTTVAVAPTSSTAPG